MPTCGNCKEPHPTVADVRACYGQGTLPTIPNQATTSEAAASGDLATERQVAYLSKLAEEREVTLEFDPRGLTKRAASAWIDRLLGMSPKAVALQHTPGLKPVRDVVVTSTVPDGTYTVGFAGGERRTLQLRQATFARDLPEGSQVVEYLAGPDNESDYVGFAFVVNGSLRVWSRFRSGHDLVVKAAKALLAADDGKREEYGLAYALESGRCRRCHRKLTVPASICRGYGQRCAELVGAPIVGELELEEAAAR